MGLADHTGDGRADLLWRHATAGHVWVWQMLGTAVASVSHVATVSDTGFRVVGTGDYDGSGFADVLWHHASTGAVWVWLMDGASIVSVNWVTTVADLGYQVQGGR